jgi:hypothetical protein
LYWCKTSKHLTLRVEEEEREGWCHKHVCGDRDGNGCCLGCRVIKSLAMMEQRGHIARTRRNELYEYD